MKKDKPGKRIAGKDRTIFILQNISNDLTAMIANATATTWKGKLFIKKPTLSSHSNPSQPDYKFLMDNK